MDGSAPGRMALGDWKKIGKGMLIVVGGSALGWLATDIIPGMEDRYPFVSGAAMLLLNVARKWLQDTR